MIDGMDMLKTQHQLDAGIVDGMVLSEQDGLLVYRFPGLGASEGVRHGVFSRIGGESRPPFDSLNMAQSVGDRSQAVAANRRRVSDAMGPGRLVILHQVHGTGVVEAPDDAAGDFGPAISAGKGDALITDRPGVWLTILVADCQAVLIWDPDRPAVANIHSGWRGSVGNIVGKTVAAMVHRFGSDPRRLFAGIGPSLGPCCAEFVNYRREIPQPFWRHLGPGYRFDFWAITREQLVDAGLSDERIFSSGICTRCSTDFFFSYRGEKATGRFAAVIGLDDAEARQETSRQVP